MAQESAVAAPMLKTVEALSKDMDAKAIGGGVLRQATVLALISSGVAVADKEAFAVVVLVFGLIVIGIVTWLTVRFGPGVMDAARHDQAYAHHGLVQRTTRSTVA